MKSSLTFLGTGASLGVPIIGCNCAVCTSRSPYNRRTRSSALLKIGDKRFVIDIGPDFREQALFYPITELDGVIITHSHQDHVAGLDDLRVYPFRKQRPLPLLASSETARDLRNRFGYLFEKRIPEGDIPALEMVELGSGGGEGKFQGVSFHYFFYEQMGMKVTGFRFGDLAYVTDIKTYSEALFTPLKGLDTLIVSALRQATAHMHLSVDDALEFGRKAGAKHIYLTHLSHDLDYDAVNRSLPSNVRLAYDGLEIPFTG